MPRNNNSKVLNDDAIDTPHRTKKISEKYSETFSPTFSKSFPFNRSRAGITGGCHVV